MRVLSNHRVVCSAIMAVVLYEAGLSHAQVLIDDFNDGNHEGWSELGDLQLGGGPPIFEVVDGQYSLRSTGPVPPICPYRLLLSTPRYCPRR